MPKPPYKPSTNIKDAIPELQKAWPKLVTAYESAYRGCTLKLTCSHRTPEEQFELYKKGRTNIGTLSDPVWAPKEYDESVPSAEREEIVTNCDGDKKMSPHNYYPARALDVVVIGPDGRESWLPERYKPLIEICRQLGLLSGGAWISLKDWPHIEIPAYRTYKPK
jgi:hypothetical protein